MEKLYTGKTKDVYQLDNGHLLLTFKDDMTGVDGVFDPGANSVGLSIAGMGQTNLSVTHRLLSLCENAGIKTHFVKKVSDNEMEVLSCQPFGKGVEVIFRNFAVGSFIRRYGLYATEKMPLNDYVEMTLKDDLRLDPLITKEGLIALGIMSETQYDLLVFETIKIAHVIGDFLQSKNAELIDIKVEFGMTKDGEIVLMDELSSGNMRVYQNNQSMQPQALSALILGESYS